jgi:hypothetical protein
MSEYLSLSIKNSKTDIYMVGKEVLISKDQTSVRPVTMLCIQWCLDCINEEFNSDSYILGLLVGHVKNVFLFIKIKNGATAKVCIVPKLKLVTPDLHLGTHSLRASGATTAANSDRY